MSKIRVDEIVDELGTGKPDFPNGIQLAGEDFEAGGGGFTYAAVSGATHDLDMDNGNFFDAGTLTADTTVTFSNVETQANWRYKFRPDVISGQWDVSKAAYIGKKTVQVGDSSPTGLFFKPDGTKFYTIGYSQDEVREFDLDPAWDLESASFVQSFDHSTEEREPYTLFFKTDGTKMYICGFTTRRVYEYNLTSAWDISTASYSNNSFDLNVSYESAVTGIFFKEDGTKMYATGISGDDINEFNLSTPWAVTSASFVTVFSVASQTTGPRSVTFKPDGSKMYVSNGDNDEIYEYNLSTPWSVSTASYSSNFTDVTSEETALDDVAFHPDGDRMYVIGRGADRVLEYSVGDVSSLTLPSSISNTLDFTGILARKEHIYEFLTTDGGTTVNLIGEEIF